MIPALLSICFAGVLVAIVAVATMVVTRRLWAGRMHLALAYGLGGIALVAWLGFVVTWFSPAAGTVLAWLILAAGLAVLVRSRAWRHWRAAAPTLLLIVGILGIYLGVLFLWDSTVGAFSLAGERFVSGSLPTDNLIPYLFSERLAAAQSTHSLIGDWNGSDRPPLQAGLLLFVRPLAAPIAGATSGAFGASIVAQVLWIPAVLAILRAFGASSRVAVIGVLMVAAAGTTMLNTLFTWPKMMSAALVLAAAVFLVDAIRRPRGFSRSFVAAVVLMVLALLAHGAAAFAVPLVVILGLICFRGQRVRRIIRACAVAVGGGILLYLPWTLYGGFADPPGDRLLKWHLAGVLSPTDTRPFLETIIASYQALSPAEWLSGRIANLQVAFDTDLLSGIVCLCPGDVASRRSAEFLRTSVALGFAVPAILVVVALIAIRLVRRGPLRPVDSTFLFVLGASVLCIALWCLVVFIPGTAVVHQGSQLWLLLLLASPVAWIAFHRRWVAYALVLVQFAFTLVIYLPPYGAHSISPAAIAVGVAGLVIVGVAVVLVGRPYRAGNSAHRDSDRSSAASEAEPADQSRSVAGAHDALR